MFSYDLERLGDGEPAAEVDILIGHQASGGVLGIFQVLVDELAVFRRGVLHDPLYHIGGHFLYQVHIVIHKKVVQYVLQLGIGQRADDLFLYFGFHVGENLGGGFLGQQPEQPVKLVGVLLAFQLLKELCKVGFLHLCNQLFDGGVLFLRQKFQNFVAHRRTSLCGQGAIARHRAREYKAIATGIRTGVHFGTSFFRQFGRENKPRPSSIVLDLKRIRNRKMKNFYREAAGLK